MTHLSSANFLSGMPTTSTFASGSNMGLGKTWTAIVGMQIAAPTGMILVVCPASLKLNWRRETGLPRGNHHAAEEPTLPPSGRRRGFLDLEGRGDSRRRLGAARARPFYAKRFFRPPVWYRVCPRPEDEAHEATGVHHSTR